MKRFVSGSISSAGNPGAHPAVALLLRGALICFFLLSTRIASESALVRHSGLEVLARELPARKVLPEYWPFLVRIRNKTEKPKTLHGEIILTAGPKESEREVARCTLYREVRPKATEEWIVQCRSTEKYGRWSLEIRRIWPFIP